MTSSDERPTLRPVTLSRLIEVTHACEGEKRDTKGIEDLLGISHRRARETLLEALRIGLLQEVNENYLSTDIGNQFVRHVKDEDWRAVSQLLEKNSDHYTSFLQAVGSVGPATLSEILSELKKIEDGSYYSYNQTSVEVLGDWAERTRKVQRDSFTGEYYLVNQTSGVSEEFDTCLLTAYDELEETRGVNLRQRHVPIPELREEVCKRLRCTRSVFDRNLVELSNENVGKVELSGAPMDTDAKSSTLGIKRIQLSEKDGLVSSSQSTQRVMSGIEQYGKEYYYFAVYDRDIQYPA